MQERPCQDIIPCLNEKARMIEVAEFVCFCSDTQRSFMGNVAMTIKRKIENKVLFQKTFNFQDEIRTLLQPASSAAASDSQVLVIL